MLVLRSVWCVKAHARTGDPQLAEPCWTPSAYPLGLLLREEGRETPSFLLLFLPSGLSRRVGGGAREEL